jgi:hypothetical protein
MPKSFANAVELVARELADGPEKAMLLQLIANYRRRERAKGIITRTALEEAASMSAQRLEHVERLYNSARAQLDEALRDAAAAAERLRFADTICESQGDENAE